MLVRLQAEINESQMKSLKSLQKAAGMKTTQKDVVTNAIALLTWAAQKKAQGCQILAVTKEGDKIEFETPFLQALALESKAG